MKFHRVIPAIGAASRAGLTVVVTKLEQHGARRLHLALPDTAGAVILELGPTEGIFVFAHGAARLSTAGEPAGQAFVDALAAWLGLVADGHDLARDVVDEPTVRWVCLGTGADPFGIPWTAFKLFLQCGERYAEVFFRLASDSDRAQFHEKWSEYRRGLVEIFERVVNAAAPRRFVPRPQTAAVADNGTSFAVHAALELEIPGGWLLTEQPEGHHRITDPDDEMAIEFSYIRLPPLSPDAPDVVARLEAVIGSSERRDTASPTTTFVRGDVSFAWSEYTFDSLDTKRPEALPRPARGRWLVATNEWIQVLLTGCWWEPDREVAERAWESVIASLSLVGRLPTKPDARGDA